MHRILSSYAQKGFTMVELLIVVLIIGLLASIALPVFNGQRQKAKDSKTQSALVNSVKALKSSWYDKSAYDNEALQSAADNEKSLNIVPSQTLVYKKGEIGAMAPNAKTVVLVQKSESGRDFCLVSKEDGSDANVYRSWEFSNQSMLQSMGCPDSSAMALGGKLLALNGDLKNFTAETTEDNSSTGTGTGTDASTGGGTGAGTGTGGSGSGTGGSGTGTGGGTSSPTPAPTPVVKTYTNMMKDPGYEAGSSGFYAASTSGVQIWRSTNYAIKGKYGMWVRSPATRDFDLIAGQQYVSQSLKVQGGKTYTVSWDAEFMDQTTGSSGYGPGGVKFKVGTWVSSGNTISSCDTSVPGTFLGAKRVSCTITPSAAHPTQNLYVHGTVGGNAGTFDMKMDNVTVTEATKDVGFFDGTTPGAVWDNPASAPNSTSTIQMTE